MDTTAALGLIEMALRLMSALALTGVSGYIAHNLITRRLRPRAVWVYAGVVASVAAAWRWAVLVWGTDVVGPWIGPVTSCLYFLLGVSLVILAVACSRGRRGDSGK